MSDLKKVLLVLFIAFVMFVLYARFATDDDPGMSKFGDNATALTPCGKNPTPELARMCQDEVNRANENYRRNAMGDYAQRKYESEGGR